VTAEEITSKPSHESGLDKLIVDSQIKAINKLCKSLDIDAVKFINSGKNSYQHFTHVRYENALTMLEYLNRYLQDPSKIPAAIKGFQENWRNTTK
jgi:hydrogenase maturation factor